jgi:hypothetical protein
VKILQNWVVSRLGYALKVVGALGRIDNLGASPEALLSENIKERNFERAMRALQRDVVPLR